MRRITTGLGGKGSLQGEKSHVSEKMTCWSALKKKTQTSSKSCWTWHLNQPPLWKGETTANENIPIRLSDHIIQAEIINQKGETRWLAMWKSQLGIQCVTAVVGLRERILYDFALFWNQKQPKDTEVSRLGEKKLVIKRRGKLPKGEVFAFLYTTEKKAGSRLFVLFIQVLYVFWRTELENRLV